jgi:PAS domain S-box-containing protein
VALLANETDSPTAVTFGPSEPDVLSVLRLTSEQMRQGMLVLGEDATILAANRQVEAIFAYNPGELIGQQFARLLPGMAVPAGTETSTPSWTDQEARPADPVQTAAGVRKGGVAVPIEIGFSTVIDSPSRYVVASIVDITDRLDLEARLKAASRENLGFQRLVADIALRFVGVESGAVDDLIVDSLRQIAEALQVDRAILWRKCQGEAVAVPTHYWVQPPHQPPPEPLPVRSIPFVLSSLEAGEAVSFSNVDELPDPTDRDTFGRRGLRSGAVVPLPFEGEERGAIRALVFSSMTEEKEWVPAVLERLRLVGGVISQALAREVSRMALLNALEEVRMLRDRLAAENVELRREVKAARTSRLIVSDSAAVKGVLAQVEQVAPTPATVLLLGETGTGKEVFAQAIHDLSPRHQRQMVRVSCAAIPAALIESELFGRERGAYTGALSRQIGRFETANRSTLFLDEIGELPLDVQVKLLRVLQERVIERLGSNQSIKVDVRIIAASNRNLEKAVEEKTFRDDLFYRLNVFPIVVPPLRDRAEDIPGLIWAFIDEFSRLFGKTIASVSKQSLQELQRYAWPGNIRELRNVIERAVILASGGELVVPVPRPSARMPQPVMTLKALEIAHIRAVLESTQWRVRGAAGAAERLGLKPTTLESRMARLGITRQRVS